MKTSRKCVQCRSPVEEGNVHAPFCSARCRMVDLGAWLSESYRVPAESSDEDEDGPAPPVTSRGPDMEQ